MRIHNHGKAAAGLFALMLLLAGCGAQKAPDTIEDTSIVIGKDGTVISHTMGIFDKEYYDLDGLRKLATEEAAAYNTANQTGTTVPVRVEKVEKIPDNSGKVMVTYRYDSVGTYEKYHEEPLFYGTIAQALDAGYDLEAIAPVLCDTAGGENIAPAALKEKNKSKKHVVITNQQAFVYCPYKAAYVSEGVTLREDGGLDTTKVERNALPAVIVLSK